eukprot:4697033-Prymnesium_polylepis.1
MGGPGHRPGGVRGGAPRRKFRILLAQIKHFAFWAMKLTANVVHELHRHTWLMRTCRTCWRTTHRRCVRRRRRRAAARARLAHAIAASLAAFGRSHPASSQESCANR